jgi:PTH1 family peptidyl-tRNA hydrolase
MKIRDWLWSFGSTETRSADLPGRFKMVVGLGNPGSRYARTRHNAGFRVVDLVAELLGAGLKQKKFGAVLGSIEYEGVNVVMLKPQKFMNRSGQVVATAAGFYRLEPKDVLVVSDDMALEPGRIRIRAKGSAGGHNGLADIISKLKSDEFARLRIGIGKSDTQPWEDYVLTEPTGEESEAIEKGLHRAREAVLCWLARGVESAMNEFNV